VSDDKILRVADDRAVRDAALAEVDQLRIELAAALTRAEKAEAVVKAAGAYVAEHRDLLDILANIHGLSSKNETRLRLSVAVDTLNQDKGDET